MNEIEKTLKESGEKRLNEGTSRPYWVIIDSRQNFQLGERGLYNIAYMTTGIFFSREDAQNYLSGRHYNFSKHAKVYCHSGHASWKYKELCKEYDLI